MRKVMSSLLAAGLTAGALALGAGAATADTYSTGNAVAPSPNDVFYVRYDTDGDGSLADEQVVMRTRAQLEAEPHEVVLHEEHAVQAVDRNGDGFISSDEWVMEQGGMRGSLDLDNNGIPDGDE